VAGVSFDIYEGETLGLVGESGVANRTHRQGPDAHSSSHQRHDRLEGIELTTQKGKALRNLRTRMQMIFQDPITRSIRAGGPRTSSPSIDCWKSVEGDERTALVNDL